MSGYPRFDGHRYVRDPYEEFMMRGLSRENDPYATRNRDRLFDDDLRRSSRHLRRSSPPPIFTFTAPREEQRRSRPPEERRSPFDSFLRLSETPQPRASRRRIDTFGDIFGDLDRPGKLNDVLTNSSVQ